MSTHPVGGRRLVASALAAAGDWLVEPAEPDGSDGSDGYSAPLETRPVVAVVGLSARCGATTVARALGAHLASRDPVGACAVTSAVHSGAAPLGLPAAARLARDLSPLVACRARACGRLCLLESCDRSAVAAAVRYVAPLVIDLQARAEAAAAAGIADHVVLVGSPVAEPALAAVLGQSLRRVGPDPVTVLNRAGDNLEGWAGRATVELPESRMGARVALAGREPRGALGKAIAELAGHCGCRW